MEGILLSFQRLVTNFILLLWHYLQVLSSDDEVFARDADIPMLLVFPASVLLSKMDMYLSTQLIIQDKVLCINKKLHDIVIINIIHYMNNNNNNNYVVKMSKC